MQKETKENTEPATEETHETVETDGKEKEVFAKADDSLFRTNRRDSLSSQLFSPLWDADTSFPGSEAGYSINKEPRRMSEVRLSSDGLFSPLGEANSPTSSVASMSMQLSFNRKNPCTSFTTPTMSPLISIREESNKTPSSPAKPLNIVKEASVGEESPLFDKEEHVNGGGETDPCPGEPGLEDERPPNIVKPNISYSRSQPEDFLSVLTAFPDLGLELGADHHSSVDHVK